MKQKRTFVALLLVIAILCLGIAYADITGIPLTINGSAKAEVGEGQVDVQFVADDIEKDNKVTAASVSTDDPTVASFTVEGLTATNETASVTYTIQNNSTDIPVTLQEPTINWTNKEWFDVTSTYSSPNIAKKGVTGETQTVTVKLKKAPVTTEDAAAASDSSITLTLQADPASSAN